jgi:prolipoprotein diacylglyceryl transferase
MDVFSYFHLYGLILGVAIVVSLSAGEWLFHEMARTHKELRHLDFYATCVWMIVFGVIGARVYHVWTDWYFYAGRSWTEMFMIWRGGLGIWGALIGGVIGLIWSLAIRDMLRRTIVLPFLDAVGFALPVGQAIGRWGNFVNGELYGKITTLPWGVSVQGSIDRYHPLFLYESLWSLFTFRMLYLAIKKQWVSLSYGKVFGAYLCWYGVARFYLETLRIAPAMTGNLATAQWISLLAIGAGAVILFMRVERKHKHES